MRGFKIECAHKKSFTITIKDILNESLYERVLRAAEVAMASVSFSDHRTRAKVVCQTKESKRIFFENL